MCIIASKPAGIKMPTDNIIENMWYGNNDGAGFMYADKGIVHIRKGFMSLRDFSAALEELGHKFDMTQLPIVMHFRITTHGGTKPENCHPFPITDSIGVLSKLDATCKVGVAHNGIIHSVTPRMGISDTMEYIAGQLAPLHRAVPDFYANKDLMQMIYNAIDSRMAFLTGKGEIYTVGDFIEDNGIKYSNSSYKWGSYRGFGYSKCYDWGGWDDEWDTYKNSSPGSVGSYYMRDVMWADSDFGYLTGVSEYDMKDMYAIDESMNVYRYDYEEDALVKIEGATMWSNTGTIIRFDPDSPTVSREMIYTPYVKSTAKVSGLPKGKYKKKNRK